MPTTSSKCSQPKRIFSSEETFYQTDTIQIRGRKNRATFFFVEGNNIGKKLNNISKTKFVTIGAKKKIEISAAIKNTRKEGRRIS